MGKGDRRTKKGKIFLGTYGKSRPHKTESAAPAKATKKAPAKKKAAAKK